MSTVLTFAHVLFTIRLVLFCFAFLFRCKRDRESQYSRESQSAGVARCYEAR